MNFIIKLFFCNLKNKLIHFMFLCFQRKNFALSITWWSIIIWKIFEKIVLSFYYNKNKRKIFYTQKNLIIKWNFYNFWHIYKDDNS